MIADPSDRRTTSSEPRVDSDLDELSSELRSELMVLTDGCWERGEEGPDEWDEDAKGDRCGSLSCIRYGCTLTYRHSV
jgi:hypothetical protein